MAPSLLSLVGLLLLSLCSSEADVLTDSNADFSARLYHVVSSRTDDNIFLSTFTLTNGLLALVSGTNGPTKDQLLQALSLTGLDSQALPGRSGVRSEGTVSVLTGSCESLHCF